MAEEGFKRKLTAILSADVAGYSRLMAEDESATVKTLETYREVMSTLILQHRGRVIDSPGDNLLAEFSSVVDAVQCAVAVQKEFQARNAQLLENRKMEFRIGVNLGDVIEEGERIYGDGVNIAARLEALADPGGICVSKTAFDHIESKLPLGYEYMGEQQVKNIPKPVGAYRVLMEPRVTVAEEIEKVKAVPVWRRKAILAAGVVLILVVIAAFIWNFYLMRPPMEVASIDKMAFPLPDKPSIAVLPFTNMSGDPEQEYIGDGISENIITALSKVAEMFVIARNSTFTYKGKAVKIQQVAEELGVQYVLEGSVQKSGDRVRVTAQLIDALSGQHLWSEKYDRKMRELFDLQDEITQKIVMGLQLELTPGDQARLYARSTDNLEAWSNVVKGYDFLYRWDKEDNARARELFESAIKLDPGYGSAWAWLALSYTVAAMRGWTDFPADYLKRAHEAIQKALKLDDKSAHAHSALGMIYLGKGEHDKAIMEGKISISLDPNDSFNYGRLGQTMFFAGQFEDAIELLKKAMRLSPYYPVHYLAFLGRSYTQLGRCEEAIPIFNEIVERGQRGECPRWMGLPGLANCYAELGREEEAQKFLDELLRLNPGYFERKGSPFKDKAIRKRRTEQLSKLAPAEKPLLPLPDKPSIAVLPFVNMSGDPEQEFLSDGISEEIITALSKSSQLFVIARESSFSYKGKQAKVQQIARELGVRYILEGSIRKSEDRVRITAQLIDGMSQRHLWAERYDRELKDIFALQDEITKEILTALQVKLTLGEEARIHAKGTENLEALLKYWRAYEFVTQPTRKGIVQARQLLEETVALDPKYAEAHRLLGVTYMLDAMYGFSKSPRDSLTTAINLVKKAITLDDSSALAHVILGFLFTRIRQYDKAIEEGERAYELGPNYANVVWLYAAILNAVDRSKESVQLYEEAMRLMPIPTSNLLRGYAVALANGGRYEESIPLLRRALKQEPNNMMVHVNLTECYWLSGREEEARMAAAEVLKINRKFSVERYEKSLHFKNQAVIERYIDALRKAGLK